MNKIKFELIDLHHIKCQLPYSLDLFGAKSPQFDLDKLRKLTTLIDGETCVLDIDEEYCIKFTIREVSIYYNWLYQLGFTEIDVSDIINTYGQPKFDISDIDFLRDYQYEDVKLTVSKFNAIFVAFTGYGKNTVIAYLIKHWLDSGNILIMAPTLSLTEEIRMRCTKYGITWDNSNWDSRYHYMVPQGFIHSNASQDPSVKDWMSKVNMILIDECETATDSMQTIIDEYCPNCKYIYGFSGSPNRYENMDLRNLHSYNRLHWETYLSIKYVGLGSIYHTSNDVLNVYTRTAMINPEKIGHWMNDYTKYNAAMKALMTADSVIQLTKDVMSIADHTIFFPVKTKAQASDLMEKLSDFSKEHDFLMVNWDASGTYSNRDYYDEEGNYHQLINGYEDLKSWVDSDKVKIIFATSVATKGIDFQLVSDVILLTLQQYNQVTQAVGRMSRYSGQQSVYLLKPMNESRVDINLGCYYGKIKKLKQSHECRLYDF